MDPLGFQLLCCVQTQCLGAGMSWFWMLNLVVFILNVKILYKEDIGTGTTIEKTPEMQRVKRTQDNISSVHKN